MGDFFHGWRRKTGITTLALACILMAGWIRSETIGDDITFRLGKSSHEIRSELSHIIFISTWARDDGRWLPGNEWTIGFSPDVETVSIWDRIGFLYHVWDFSNPDSSFSFQRLLMVPYWSIVVPLTFLSCWLLLSKPHKSIQLERSVNVTVGGVERSCSQSSAERDDSLDLKL